MTLSVLESHSLVLQAFTSAIFRIFGASCCPSASAELLLLLAAIFWETFSKRLQASCARLVNYTIGASLWNMGSVRVRVRGRLMKAECDWCTQRWRPLQQSTCSLSVSTQLQFIPFPPQLVIILPAMTWPWGHRRSHNLPLAGALSY